MMVTQRQSHGRQWTSTLFTTLCTTLFTTLFTTSFTSLFDILLAATAAHAGRSSPCLRGCKICCVAALLSWRTKCACSSQCDADRAPLQGFNSNSPSQAPAAPAVPSTRTVQNLRLQQQQQQNNNSNSSSQADLMYKGPCLRGVHTPREPPREALLQGLHQSGEGIQDRLMQTKLGSHVSECQEALHEASSGSLRSLSVKEVVVLVVAMTPVWA